MTGPIAASPPGPVHPDIARVVAMLREADLSPRGGGDVHATRAYLDRLAAFTGRTSRPLAQERNLVFAVNGRDVPCKLYWPDDAKAPPLLVYCHGGGFRHGSLPNWDAPLRQLARSAGAAILSIGYALAPEHRFPAAFDEVTTILDRVARAQTIDGRAIRGLAAGGDSAGANLALGAALALRDAGVDALRHLMLLYGVYSRDLSRPSWARLGGHGGQSLSAASMGAHWADYLGADLVGSGDWRAEPLLADLAGLPPTRLTIGDLDPLVDENVALAEKMAASGVAVSLTILPSLVHGVVRFNEIAPVVHDMIEVEARRLRDAFA
jgi:acetyl esterase